ncbi:DUF3592 domain-containing protein [Actinoallomurus vinaceus]
MRLELRFRRRAIRATGRVVALKPGGTLLRWVDYESWDVRYFPVVEFTTRQGRAVRATSSVGRRRGTPLPSHRIGSKIPIAYDPDDPTTVRWRPFYGSTLLALWGCLASGAVCVAAGIVFFFSVVTS